MIWKTLKVIGSVAVAVILDVDDKSEEDRFIDEYSDGMGNVNHCGDDYAEQEARDTHARGELYK